MKFVKTVTSISNYNIAMEGFNTKKRNDIICFN